MIIYIFLWLGVTVSYISGGYHMDYQIAYPYKGFKTVKLKGFFRKIFIFRNKNRVMKVALISQIVGYLIFFIGICINTVLYFLPQTERMEYEGIYIKFAIALGVLGGIYEVICMGFYKMSNKKEESIKR